MKKWILFILYTLFMGFTMSYGQVCIDIDNSSISSSTLHYDGRQKHSLELDLIHDGSTSIDFIANCTNGSILGPAIGTLPANTVTSVTIEVLLDADASDANITFAITSGQTNACPNNVYIIPVPVVDICLDIVQGNETNCYLDNDGIGYDGEVHVYEMTYYNNSTGEITFDLTSNSFVLPYNRQTLGAFQTATFTYLIYVDGGQRNGSLTLAIQGQHLNNGCLSPLNLTFAACQQDVCLQAGQMTFDGCTGPDVQGAYLYTYNVEVHNMSNLPLEYILYTPSGQIVLGNASRTIAALSSETISFDYKPSQLGAADWTYSLQLLTPSTNNLCSTINTQTLPSCADQYGNMQVLAFYDQNNNGVKDLQEVPLSNVHCSIQLQSGGGIINGITNEAGIVLFSGLTPGLYLVNQEVSLPWTATFGGALNNVLVSANNITYIEFANQHPNDSIDPITIHHMSGVCQSDTALSSYIFSGLLSTSFFDKSMLSIYDVNGGVVSNIAVGDVPSLAQAIPFSFQFTGNTDPCFLLRLSTPLTQAMDTICMTLPQCCTADTALLQEDICVSVDHGTFLPVGNQGIRISEVSVENIPQCIDHLTINNPNQSLVFNGIYVKDGDTSLINNPSMPYTFSFSSSVSKLDFFIDAQSGSGQLIITASGCRQEIIDTVFIGSNVNSQVASITQTQPQYSNIYGASFDIALSSNAKAKYITLGLEDFANDTKILGGSGGHYFYFPSTPSLAVINQMRNDDAHIHFVLDNNADNNGKHFNIFYSGSQKSISLRYTIYSENGSLLGKGSILLDGNQILSQVGNTAYVDVPVVYPVPAYDRLYIKYGNKDAKLDYTITSANGEKILSGQYYDDEYIKIDQLIPGTYVVSITDKDTKHTHATTIIKMR